MAFNIYCQGKILGPLPEDLWVWPDKLISIDPPPDYTTSCEI